jgi:putative CocE/NonD family hydrolase
MVQMTRRRSFLQRTLDRQWLKYLRLAPTIAGYSITRDIPIPMRDRVILLGDILEPDAPAKGTILITSPYGWNVVATALTGGVFVCRDFRVVLVRCRGTFGSGGVFEPFMHEIEDGADIVAWMRGQAWWDGRFGTYGYSYSGFTQWALLTNPPPELAASVIACAPFSFGQFLYGRGAFLLSTMLEWSFVTARQEKPMVSRIVGNLRARGAIGRALAQVPLTDAADSLFGADAPWYREWLTRRDTSDEWWRRADLTDAVERVAAPVLIQAGWQDGFVHQSIAAYARIAARGAPVGLTVGPWTHTQGAASGARVLVPDALAWFDEHLARLVTDTRPAEASIFIGGDNAGWQDLPHWPPATTQRVLYAGPDKLLTDRVTESGTTYTFVFDPTQPTPAVGGAFISQLSPGFSTGYVDDSAYASRPDVVVLTTRPLVEGIELMGTPRAVVRHRTDNPFADLYVRISDVDRRGRSVNVCDGFVRLDPNEPQQDVEITLDPAAHRFAPGHRLRLLISGGAHPRWERNLGTGEDPATSTHMRPSHREIGAVGTRLQLPVT